MSAMTAAATKQEQEQQQHRSHLRHHPRESALQPQQHHHQQSQYSQSPSLSHHQYFYHGRQDQHLQHHIRGEPQLDLSHVTLASAPYDADGPEGGDDSIHRQSPLMKPITVKIAPTPSPPPEIPPSQIRQSHSVNDFAPRGNPDPRQLSSARNAIAAPHRLANDDDFDEFDDDEPTQDREGRGSFADSSKIDNASTPYTARDMRSERSRAGADQGRHRHVDIVHGSNQEFNDSGARRRRDTTQQPFYSIPSPRSLTTFHTERDRASIHAAPRSAHMSELGIPDLQNLAAGALNFVEPAGRGSNPTHEITKSTHHLSIRDDRPSLSSLTPSLGYTREGLLRPSPATGPPTMHHINVHDAEIGALAPIQTDLVPPDASGRSLPSLRSHLSEFNNLDPASRGPLEAATVRSSSSQPQNAPFPRSPSIAIPRLSSVSHAAHSSPPISPQDSYGRHMSSPHSQPATSPYYSIVNGLQHSSLDCASSSTAGGTPSTEHSSSTPATSTSVADRMSIDGVTQTSAATFKCIYAGCTAPAFQTQYLLNSHANVHSIARPHFCPVQGCSRSEGGKGFKRKNEMIRHGLVHDSPGYVCPFCSDREHKYPRPDNLQRHVRVHHAEKHKDDPSLREVLAQRPDGPSRGRRRRGVVS